MRRRRDAAVGPYGTAAQPLPRSSSSSLSSTLTSESESVWSLEVVLAHSAVCDGLESRHPNSTHVSDSVLSVGLGLNEARILELFLQVKPVTVLITHVNESRGSKAFIRVCLSVCVCLCVWLPAR